MENLSQGKRMLIATALAIVFFFVWGQFFAPQPQQAAASNVSNSNLTITAETNNAAPQSLTPMQAPKVNEVASARSNALTILKTEEFEATIDELGRISSWILLDEKFKAEDGEQINLITASPLPLEVRFTNANLNQLAFTTAYEAKNSVGSEGGELVLTQKLGEITLEKRIVFQKNGAYKLSVKALNKDGKPSKEEFFVTTGHRPNVMADAYAFYGTRIKTSDAKFKDISDGDLSAEESFKGAIFVSNTDRYYTTLLFNPAGLDVTILPQDKTQIPFVRAVGELEATGFVGAKIFENLKAIDNELKGVVEYGFFTFIAKYMFSFLSTLFGIFGNWGWAIVAMTIVMRIILFPLTYRSMVSMGKMKDLAPKMQELREKHKNDPAKMQAAIMELYKKTGVNPVSGCLPILLQIPIFFAVYRVLLNAIELKGAEWIGWYSDLAQKDPYFVLPILMGISMYIQQKMTPTAIQDKTQVMVLRWLPIIFTFFFLWFPAGLTLYWCVNNICSIAQQYAVNKMLKAKKDKK